MQRALIKQSAVKPPKELARLFADPPVARNESLEDYENLFAAIAAAAQPADAIAWLFIRDITDLSWEIRREKSLKVRIIKAAEKSHVKDLLAPPKPFILKFPDFHLPAEPDPEAEQAWEQARQWSNGDPRVRRKVEKILADRGDDASSILFAALEASHTQIDAIDKRIATYELRRLAALKEVELWNAILARRLEAASSDVIDGEFSEAAE